MTNNSGKSLYCLLLVAFLGILFIVNIGYGDPYYEEWPIDDPNDDTDTCVGCCKGCCGPCCGEDECDDCDPGPPPPPPPPGPPGPPPPPPPPPGPTGGDPVYIRNGEFRYYHTDFSIEGRALGLTLKRTYGSRRRYNSPFGYGWDINYNMKVRILDDPNTIVYVNGKGCTVEYDNIEDMSEEEFFGLCDFEPPDVIQKVLQNGKGLVVVAAHFGNWELMAAAVVRQLAPVSPG